MHAPTCPLPSALLTCLGALKTVECVPESQREPGQGSSPGLRRVLGKRPCDVVSRRLDKSLRMLEVDIHKLFTHCCLRCRFSQWIPANEAQRSHWALCRTAPFDPLLTAIPPSAVHSSAPCHFRRGQHGHGRLARALPLSTEHSPPTKSAHETKKMLT